MNAFDSGGRRVEIILRDTEQLASGINQKRTQTLAPNNAPCAIASTSGLL
ncbi:hypothetical protein HAT93_03170 [Dickeya solani]|nr:hypothetical protein [Dickeya solani]